MSEGEFHSIFTPSSQRFPTVPGTLSLTCPSRRRGGMLHFVSCRFALLVLAACGLHGLASAAFATDSTVDFRREVWPILEARCLACHGDNKVKGGLRLDSREALASGGNLGQNLQYEPAKTNDLLRRIRSPDPDERMPLEGPPLKPEETALIERWLEEGALWPDGFPVAAGAALPRRWTPPESWLDHWLPFFVTTRSAWIGLLVVMLGVLVIERSRRRLQLAPGAREPGWLTRGLASVPRLSAVVGILLVALWGQHLVTSRERQMLARVQAQLQKLQSERTVVSAKSAKQIVAKHPPRLGGEYYRGNDERSPELFNGGFYRTATLSVHLVDDDGKACAWNDPYPAQPRIQFTIDRATNATPRLFSDRIMSKAFLTTVDPSLPGTQPAPDLRRLETLVPSQKWQVSYELPSCSASDRIRGELFVCNELNMDATDKLTGQPHYRIDYNLTIQDGRIDPKSRIALVSLFQPANVMSPQAQRLTPEEWFDFRPIPEIEGEPSSDPVLLGIPEHERALAPENPR